MIKDKPTEICTERLSLRSINDTDKDNIIKIITNKKNAETFILPDFKSSEEEIRLYNRLKELSQNMDRFVYGIELGGEIIGFINDVEIVDDTIELGFVIHPEYHNRGFATESLSAAIKILFDMGYKTVKTGVFECNLPSQRVMEKAGMTKLDVTESIEYRGVTHKCFLYEIKPKEY